MKKAAVGSLFLSSSVNLVAAQLIQSIILFGFFFLFLTTYQFLSFVSYLSLLPSLLCLLNCFSVGCVSLQRRVNTTSHLPVICSLVCIIFNGRVSIWPSKYRISFSGKCTHSNPPEVRRQLKMDAWTSLSFIHPVWRKSTLEYQILIWIVEMKRRVWNVQSHWLLLLQQQPQLLRMSLEGVLGVKSCPILQGSMVWL